MTLSDLQFDIEKINHSKASRSDAVDLVLDNLEVIPELVDKAFSSDKIHFKYCWWLEFLNRQHIEVLCPYMELILTKAEQLTNQSAIRPIARMIETYCLNYYSKTPNSHVIHMMTDSVKELMVTRCFEWLIDDQLKVAPRAYSMISLFHLGKDVAWVHPELQLIIEHNYLTESDAYKARARMVLNKLRN
ncbi:MAG: adenylosuccinate lyase [Flavobacteriaceae bacterium]